MGIKSKIKSLIRTVLHLFKEKTLIPIPQPVNGERLLENKVALITGGSSGIGLACAEAFLNHGAKVIIAGTDETKLCNALKKIGGGKVYSLVLDVRDVNSLPEKVRLAASLAGEDHIDILVNSAGLVAKSDFFSMTEAEYDGIMDVNAKGTFFMGKAVGEFMIEKKTKGHILNVTSSSALRPAWGPYQMSKWAVRGFTLGLADTLIPYGITVNAIAPGPTATPMLKKAEGDNIWEGSFPAGRYATPQEIAQLAVFMVSGLGDMIIGDTFYMTGGSGTISFHH